MKSLIEEGHKVTVVTSFPDLASQENYSSVIDVSKDEIPLLHTSFATMFEKSSSTLIFQEMVLSMEKSFCYKIMKLPEIQLALSSNQKVYDVIFIEILNLYRCFTPIAAKLNVPVIGTETLKYHHHADYSISNPQHPGYIFFEPGPNRQNLDSFLGRFNSVWNNVEAILHNYLHVIPYLEKFHEDYSHQLATSRAYTDVAPSLIFYNSHSSILARPMVSNAIEIGGIHMKRAKSLPKDIEKFIDEAVHGVILFSLGSVLKAATLPAETINAFREAFAEIPQRVIWKYESQLENVSSNVMLLDWLPQRDILEHKNVKAFISQCGLGAINEAIHTATPIIACAIWADQIINANILKKKEVAVELDITNVSKEDILTALNAIINDTKYHNNMEKLSKIFKDRPKTPQQSVVYWTEYIVKHKGASHLKSISSELNWIQYLLLDVIVFILSIFILIGTLLYYAFKYTLIILTHNL
ncbi:UDP-glucosyltransferase 2-like isoform X2 [Planococcus citri]